jgi:hypothetical protein
MMNGKGFERKWFWLNRGTVSTHVWTNWGNPQKDSVKIASILTEIPTQPFSNTHLDRCRYANPLGESRLQLLPRNLIATRDTMQIAS